MSHYLFCHDKLVAELDLPVGAFGGEGWGLHFWYKPPFELSPHLKYIKGNERGLEKTSIRHFFVNYLPESPYAERVAARFSPRPQNDAQLLACLGHELAGAFSVEETAKKNIRAKRADGYDALTLESVETSVHDSSSPLIALPQRTSSGPPAPTRVIRFCQLARVTPAYLAQTIQDLLDRPPAATARLASQLGQKLTSDELDFLSERINPVIQLRAQWLQDAIPHLKPI
jgi:HipA-like protein